MTRNWWNYPEPTSRVLSDSDRNILADLAHEGCEAHCDDCGRCDWEPTGPTSTRPVPMTTVNGVTYCPDCVPLTADRAADT